jgi:hypothetical protein
MRKSLQEMPAIQFNYYDDWRNALLTCPVCGWQGRWEEAEINHHRELMDAECPRCDSHPPMLAIVSYATGEETKLAAQAGNAEAIRELRLVSQRESRLEVFARDKLKSIDQLPDLPDASGEFIWDIVEDEQDKFQEIRAGDRLIWRELAFWENRTRFGEIEDLLKKKYGTRFKSLTPTPGSEMWLWGDKSG